MKQLPIIDDLLREQIILVRDTGRTNMFVVHQVQSIARELGLTELVSFLGKPGNRSAYWRFILYGKTSQEAASDN